MAIDLTWSGVSRSRDPYYPVIGIDPAWVLEPEVMGSKSKFWYRHGEGPSWLFKYPQPGTGQHWAEKIAAEVADHLGILHARVELATFEGVRGSTAESFAVGGRELFHGNQVLAGLVLGYDAVKRFGQSDHTLGNILLGLERAFAAPYDATQAKRHLADYLVLDALIGNTDRHHENWGILHQRTETGWRNIMAPSFDHASSLGRELADDGVGRCRGRLLAEGRLAIYVERARGAIFWSTSDRRGISPLELIRRAAATHPELFDASLARLAKLDRATFDGIVRRVPEDWMSDLARRFATELMCYTLGELREIA